MRLPAASSHLGERGPQLRVQRRMRGDQIVAVPLCVGAALEGVHEPPVQRRLGVGSSHARGFHGFVRNQAAPVDCAGLSGEPVTETDVQFPPPEPFRCERGHDGDRSWVRPVGELDLDTAPVLDQEIGAARAAGAASVVLDMRGLTFMDSTGLRLVIRWDTAAREESFEFAIVPGIEVVHRVFRLTGMDEHLRVAEPPPEA